MQPVMVSADRFCQPDKGRITSFCLIVDESAADEFDLVRTGGYQSYEIMMADGSQSADRLLRTELPEGSDVLIVSRTGAARPLPVPDLGGRLRLTILPCGTTPTASGDMAMLLASLERCATPAEEELADRLRSRLATGGVARVVSSAAVQVLLSLDECEIDEITYFRSLTLSVTGDSVAPLPLTGKLAVRGRPIVRTADLAANAAEQLRRYEALLPLVGSETVLQLEAGLVVDVTPAEPGSDRAARALTEFFDAHPACRVVTRLGIGLDLVAQELLGNHEVNIAVGGSAGRIFTVLGDLSQTDFEVVVPSPASSLEATDGTWIAGATGQSSQARPRRRLNRVKSASCGCH